MSKLDIKEKTIAMRNGSTKMERDREYWSDDERKRLKEQFFDGVPINEIALELKRSESAVSQQIASMGLYNTPTTSRRNRSSRKEPVCLCSVCCCDCSICPRFQNCKAAQEE